MSLKAIAIKDLLIKPFHLWDVQTLLLASGDLAAGDFNAMTVGWGSIGYMWRRPFVQVVVRPVRYTYEFMERYETFTLTAFPPQQHAALQLMGTKSGREMDKVAASGLTPIAAEKVAAPTFAEAELSIECRKLYWDDFNPQHFLDAGIDANYPKKDYHRFYFGEIVAVHGSEAFLAR